jgi:type I restriction enzyme R subunit
VSSTFTESVVEDAALAWLAGLGWQVRHGPDVAAGEPGAERSDPAYRDVILARRVREALTKMNPRLPVEAIDDAFRKVTRADAPSLIERNRAVHRMLVEGIDVQYRRPDGSIGGDKVRILDFDNPDNNDWLAVNQFTVSETQHTRRPDVVLFVNGLALGVLELKNAAAENATMWTAFQQLQTYQSQIPALFTCNAALVASDGVQSRIGVLGAGREWFKPWRTIGGEEDAPAGMAELQVVLEGVFAKHRLLQLVRHFIVFEDFGSGSLAKKMAGYHQFHAVNIALEETLRAAHAPRADRVSEERGRYAAAPPGGDLGDRRRRCVAHAGFRQEPDDGVLCGTRHLGSTDGQPDGGRADRSQRPRRPVVRHVRALQGSPASGSGAGSGPG